MIITAKFVQKWENMLFTFVIVKNLFNGQAGHKSWPPHLIDSNLWHLFGIILGLFYHFRYKSKGGMGALTFIMNPR